MPKNTNKQYAKALYEIVKDSQGEKLYKALNEFAAILARDHKLKQADKIIQQFVKYAKVAEGIKEIEITAARKLDEQTIKKISNAFGKKVEAKIIIDPDIIGGIKIKTEDKILDGSLKTQLLNLKKIIA